MNIEGDPDLSPDQWDVLKALRAPVANGRLAKSYVVESLIARGLVVVRDGSPTITAADARSSFADRAACSTSWRDRPLPLNCAIA
jgi:hypothetical protein